MSDFQSLAQQCAPTVAIQTMSAIVKTESGFNPFAIGVVGGRLARQPRNLEEAVATAQGLTKDGWNFSMGIAQVNRHNLPKTWDGYAKAFDQCTNLALGSRILTDCYQRAQKKGLSPQQALQAAMSCYYSGNFTRGFQQEQGKPSYVQRVLRNATPPSKEAQTKVSLAKTAVDNPAHRQAQTTSPIKVDKNEIPAPPVQLTSTSPVSSRKSADAAGPAMLQPAAPRNTANSVVVF